MKYIIEVYDSKGGWVVQKNIFNTEENARINCKGVAKNSGKMSRVIGISDSGPDEIIIAFAGTTGKAIY